METFQLEKNSLAGKHPATHSGAKGEGQKMWIELTDCFGQPVTLNSRHIVALKTCGEKTLIAHAAGETLVLESHAQIKAALQLQPIERPAQKAHAEPANLH